MIAVLYARSEFYQQHFGEMSVHRLSAVPLGCRAAESGIEIAELEVGLGVKRVEVQRLLKGDPCGVVASLRRQGAPSTHQVLTLLGPYLGIIRRASAEKKQAGFLCSPLLLPVRSPTGAPLFRGHERAR